MKINKRLLGILGTVVLVFVVVLGFIFLSQRTVAPVPGAVASKIEVVDPQTGRTMTFYADGLVSYVNEDGQTVSEVWETEKINSFFEYIQSQFSEEQNSKYQVTINGQTGGVGSGGDELIDTATGDPGAGGGGTTQYFATPLPAVTPYSFPIQGSNPTPEPTLPPSAPSWCRYWRLSYCADQLIVTPAPSPSYPPGVVTARDCEEWTTKSDNKTVISGFACTTPAPGEED